VTHIYKINWEKEGIEEYQGSRYVFSLDERSEEEKEEEAIAVMPAN
jgi:hypothetical protein